MRDAKPVVIFQSEVSMEHLKLTSGALPTAGSPGGSYVLDPQSRRLYLTMCGHTSNPSSKIALIKGYPVYTIRVKEAVQVMMWPHALDVFIPSSGSLGPMGNLRLCPRLMPTNLL